MEKRAAHGALFLQTSKQRVTSCRHIWRPIGQSIEPIREDSGYLHLGGFIPENIANTENARTKKVARGSR